MDDFAAGLAVERTSVFRQNETPKRKIADHGVIDNLSTMALVATDGAIDFLCWPRFDSPSIFAAILDEAVGGVFELAPEIADGRVVQTYLPDSNVLITRWLGAEASAEIMDLMTGFVELGKGAGRRCSNCVAIRAPTMRAIRRWLSCVRAKRHSRPQTD